MAGLPQSEQAFSDVVANGRIMFGAHDGDEIKVGGQGVYVGDRPFDPERDNPLAINPFSIWESVTGEQHVSLHIPERPLHISVVTHDRQQSAADKLGIIPAKQRIAHVVTEALYDSLPGMTDRIYNYSVGEAAGTRGDEDVEVVDTNGDQLVDAQKIADICKYGLTIVISDFLKLPLEQTIDKNDTCIAIKANHKFDVALPPNVGILPSGYRGGEINTDGPSKGRRLVEKITNQAPKDDFAEVNQLMSEAHLATIARLLNAGIAVAHFILQPNTRMGFDAAVADQEIARAIESLERR